MDDLQQLQDAVDRVVSNVSNLREQLRDAERRLTTADYHRAHLAERLKHWETKMECGHPEAALIVDDPLHCSVCDQQAELALLRRQRTYDLERCGEAHRVTLQELGDLKRQLSQSSHDMDTAGQCDADCPACERTRQEARSETIDALDHPRTCPPNMCRKGHPEIRYETPGGGEPHGCPLCRALADFKALQELLERFFNKHSREVLAGMEPSGSGELSNRQKGGRYQGGTKADH